MHKTLRFTLLGSLLTAQAITAQTAPQSVPPLSIPSQQTAPAQTNSASAPLIGFGLEDGTPVKLRLTRNLSSASDKKGDTVDFEVIEDVNVNGTLIIPRGGIAWATITDAEPKRRMGRGGKLDVNVDSVRLSDGEKVALRAVKDNKGGGHVGAMTGAMVATSIVFFPAAPLFLFMKGKDINIPKGTEITGYIAGNIPMDQAKFQGAESAQARTASTVAAAQQTAVSILSTPGAADVEVDGKFVGNTPATLTLTSGEHTVKVSKNGYKPWERALNVSGGTANVNAELQQDK
jgi:hypothetical protein